VQLEGFELRLGVARQLLVQLLLLDVAAEDDDAAAGIRQSRDVSDEVEPGSRRPRVESLDQFDPLRASLGLRGAVQESVRIRRHTPNLKSAGLSRAETPAIRP